MRRSEREITDLSEIEEILRKARVVHIGLADEGAPHVVPMEFGYAAGRLYLHSAPEGRKIDLLRRNPNVSFAAHIDHEVIPGVIACKWSSKYRSVMGKGKASFVEERQDKIRALDTIMEKFASGPFQYSDESLARTAVIQIEIESMTGKKIGYPKSGS
jgi:uncharacterized protein